MCRARPRGNHSPRAWLGGSICGAHRTIPSAQQQGCQGDAKCMTSKCKAQSNVWNEQPSTVPLDRAHRVGKAALPCTAGANHGRQKSSRGQTTRRGSSVLGSRPRLVATFYKMP